MGDLTICADILNNYLNTSDSKAGVPFQDLRYLFGEIMYGGHITDFWDRRTCETYLAVTFHEGLVGAAELAPKFVSPDPVGMTYSSYNAFIDRAMPAEVRPSKGSELHNAMREANHKRRRGKTIFIDLGNSLRSPPLAAYCNSIL